MSLTPLRPNVVNSPEQLAMLSSPGMKHLEQLSRVHIREHVSFIELMSNLDVANHYTVSDQNGLVVFKAAQKAGWCMRQIRKYMCSPDCQAFDAAIEYTGDGRPQSFLNLNRPFSCVCCCFNRPKADIHYVPSGLKIGSISDPWTCLCNYRFNIQDVDGSNVLRVDGGCCQWGIIAPCPCGPCSRVTFDVSDLATGRNVATLVKHNPGLISCRRRCCPHVNYYSVKFANVDARSKALLIATSIFLDFRFFNTKDSPDEPKETNPLDGVQDQS